MPDGEAALGTVGATLQWQLQCTTTATSDAQADTAKQGCTILAGAEWVAATAQQS